MFSRSAQASVNTIAIEKAEGNYLYEVGEKRIIDFSNGLMSANNGYRDLRVTAAVVEQMPNTHLFAGITFLSLHLYVSTKRK